MPSKLPSLLLLFLPLLGCGSSADNATATEREEMTEDVGSDTAPAGGEWIDLFNGENLDGWHRYGQMGEVGSGWKIDNGAIYLDPGMKDGGDLTTDAAYANYELELEWKISDCGNSGIIYNVQETPDYNTPWKTGPEMQVLDSDCHADGKIHTHRSGDLYDMVAVKTENEKPVGEWNSVKLVVTDGEVQHWQNGELQITYRNTGDEWKKMIADSKFKSMPNWGMFTEGKISLQDHGDAVWFRNIRLRELSK